VERAACPVSDGLWLLEGSEDLATRGRRHLESDLERLCGRIQASLSAFDVWLIDTPPEIGELALAALCAASHVLVVTETLAQSVRGLVQLTSTVERLGSGGEGPAVVGILPTFFESRPLHHREALRVLNELYPGMVLQPIRKSIVVADAETERMPIVAAYPSHPCSQAYRDITREILTRAGD
jgi:chromosome partitioning protein